MTQGRLKGRGGSGGGKSDEPGVLGDKKRVCGKFKKDRLAEWGEGPWGKRVFHLSHLEEGDVSGERTLKKKRQGVPNSGPAKTRIPRTSQFARRGLHR